MYEPDREKPFRAAWARTGKKLDMGKSCVRFRKVEDPALELIGATIRGISADGFIACYESVINGAWRRPANKPARTVRKPAGSKPKQLRRKARLA